MSRNGKVEIEAALRRSRVYQRLSDAFSYPEEEFFLGLKGPFLEELEDDLSFPGRRRGGGKRQRAGARLLREQFRGFKSLPDLVSEYTRAFGHTLSEECPPYETQCGGPHVFQQTQQLADIAGFYRVFGLRVSDSAMERLDHITVELEFMRFLTYKQAYADSHHGEERIALCLDGQRKFLEEHLGRWIPVFTTLLAKKVQCGFYKELAVLTDQWVREDGERIGAKPRSLGENTWDPAGLLEESCSTCPMDPSSQEELVP